MSTTSRSGLVPTPKRNFKFIRKRRAPSDQLPSKFEGTPMPLSLRPFSGLCNPFAKGCSVLCNHPAPTEMKNIIHQLKTTLAIEGKHVPYAKEKFDNARSTLQQHAEHDNIPEDLFRRYTDTDSRPLTPTPTVTSVHTRNSAGSFLNRRCITPEWGKHEVIKRKQIILDLRRSHSQETLYWKPLSDLSQSIGNGDGVSSDAKPKSAGANEEKPKRQKSGEQRPKSSMAAASMPEHEEDLKQPQVPQTCINELVCGFDEDDIRRGKKRKKLKPTPATTTFHLSEDPETQVAALGPDSLNPSTRPSLIPNSISLLPHKEKHDAEPVLLKGSFLTDEAFQALKTELDVDVIENTFERYLNRARREAIKYIPPKSRSAAVASASASIEAEKDKPTPVYEYTAKMPRKFSKSATRFDVPLDLKLFATMTSLDYLSKYVWVSRQRKQLYKRVFLKYLVRLEEQHQHQHPQQQHDQAQNAEKADEATLRVQRGEYIERTMNMQALPAALEDVLEFHGTIENVQEVLRLLDYELVVQQRKQLDFRSWCGIVSFAERLALTDPTCTDSCDELEKADFNSMELRLESMDINSKLREVLNVIRRTHNLKY